LFILFRIGWQGDIGDKQLSPISEGDQH